MLDDNDIEVSWENAGLYNSLHDLPLADFRFNENTWRWEYHGKNNELVDRIVMSANPYEFEVKVDDDGYKSFSLIIDDGEVLGISAVSESSYTIVPGYRAMQELYVAINFDKTVEVPTISTYQHDEAHDELQQAIDNMCALSSYKVDFKQIVGSPMSSEIREQGFIETVTYTECYFQPYQVKYVNSREVHETVPNTEYGFHKVSADLYNSYSYDSKQNEYIANRAFAGAFTNARPSFAFAAELFRKVEIDEANNSKNYYVDSLMSRVATTWYKHMSTDTALYGIFATEGRIDAQTTFTPYVTVKDGYITNACFYFYMGNLYGVIELTYSDFNTAALPEGVHISLKEDRQVPSSWNDVKIDVEKDDNLGVTVDDNNQAVATDYLKAFFNDDDILQKLPYFGSVLGDTYGFGMMSVYTSPANNRSRGAVAFYFDVPVDYDYTINSSMAAVRKYLLGLGFEKNQYGEYTKDGICIAPTDSQLDFIIYVWKA